MIFRCQLFQKESANQGNTTFSTFLSLKVKCNGKLFLQKRYTKCLQIYNQLYKYPIHKYNVAKKSFSTFAKINFRKVVTFLQVKSLSLRQRWRNVVGEKCKRVVPLYFFNNQVTKPSIAYFEKIRRFFLCATLNIFFYHNLTKML